MNLIMKKPNFSQTHLSTLIKVPFLVIALFFMLFITPNRSIAQEFRAFSALQFLGEINGGFSGAGLGFESAVGRHLSLAADLALGFQSVGSTVTIQPAVLFYPKEDQRGVFFGPSFKYILLDEKGENARYADKLYALGFSVGVKTKIRNGPMLFLMVNPHKTVGGPNESDVAGISGQLGLSFKL